MCISYQCVQPHSTCVSYLCRNISDFIYSPWRIQFKWLINKYQIQIKSVRNGGNGFVVDAPMECQKRSRKNGVCERKSEWFVAHRPPSYHLYWINYLTSVIGMEKVYFILWQGECSSLWRTTYIIDLFVRSFATHIAHISFYCCPSTTDIYLSILYVEHVVTHAR